ncbi:MAG: DUF3857 domain-containing protein, partial [Acidobacteria bacterium]|nr:DUF3857 domain-containing protein [Acidobacteriota bacterium]
MKPSSCSVVAWLLPSLLVALVLSPPARAALPDHPAIRHAGAADWVEPAGSDDLPQAAGGTRGVAYLRLDDQVLVAGDASACFRDRLVEVTSQNGLNVASQWEIHFAPAFQRVVVHTVALRRDDVWYDRLASTEASVLHREDELGSKIYNEELTLLLVLSDVRVGDVVRIAYTLEGANPIFGGRSGGSFPLAWGVPVSRLDLRFTMAATTPFHFRVLGDAPPPEERVENGRREIRWHLEDLPDVDFEANAPDSWIRLPFVAATQFATWAEVAAWGSPLFAPEPLPAEVAAVAARIRTEHPDDPEARFLAASRWVQDEIRYFAMALGPHSHAPYDVDQIVRRRFGDCKDKTRLLLSLLAAVGIEAAPALVRTDLDVSEWLPTPLAFDHVVTVAEVAGREVWVDATLTHQGGASSDDLYFPDYHTALVLRPETTGLTGIGLEQTRPGITEVRYDYRVSEAGEPLEVRIASVYERDGAESMRRLLDGTSPEDLLESYVEYYSDGPRKVESLAPLEISDDRDANRLEVDESYRVVECWQPDEQRTTCNLLPLNLGSRLVEPQATDREAPLWLPEQLHIRETIAIQAATPWEFSPVDVAERNPWFAYTVTSKPAEQSIELVYELETLAAEVEPQAIRRYASSLKTLTDSVGYSLYTEEDDAEPADSEAQDMVYGIIGCAVILFVAVVGIGGLVGLVVLLRKRSPKTRSGPPASTADGVCPRCSATLDPGGRYCPRCGLDLRPVAKTGGTHPGLIVVAITAVLVFAVAMIGIVAAILIPNFIDALGKARQLRTVAELRSWSSGLDRYHKREGTYPDAESLEALAAILAAEAPADGWSMADTWKHPFVYRCWNETGGSGCDTFRIASPGTDGVLSDPSLESYETGS